VNNDEGRFLEFLKNTDRAPNVSFLQSERELRLCRYENRIRASIPLNMKPFQGLTKVRQRRRNLRVFNLEFKLQLISSCHDIMFETQADLRL
jgi:hypothetical protein